MWTDTAIIDLTRMWSEGRPARLIAEALGAISKNAVIGKAHRLNLPARKETQEPSGTRPRMQYAYRGKQRKPRASKQLRTVIPIEKPKPTPIDDRMIPLEQRKSLQELNPWHCRWPVHDTDHPEFFFCGGIATEGKPYCPAHCERAFIGTERRGR